MLQLIILFAFQIKCENYFSETDNGWNMKPETLDEYMQSNNLYNIPKGEKITLFKNNKSYQVYVNNESEIIIPDAEIIYNYYLSDRGKTKSNLTGKYPVILDPKKMKISGFKKNPFVMFYKRRRHGKKLYGHEMIRMSVNLGPLFEFDHEINSLDFKGDGLPFMILNANYHSFNINFKIPYIEAKNYKRGPFFVELKNMLEIKLV